MHKFFQRSKKLKKRKNTQTQSPPVSSVATQSEPLPISFHLAGLLNSPQTSRDESHDGQEGQGSFEESFRETGDKGWCDRSGGQEEVDGAVCHAHIPAEEQSQLSGRPPLPTPPRAVPRSHSLVQQCFSPHQVPCCRTRQSCSWEEEEEEGRGLGYWPGDIGHCSPSESSQLLKAPPYNLPPPLIPSPPLTLTPSPSPPTTHTVTFSQVPQPQSLSTPTHVHPPQTTPTHPSVAALPASYSLSPQLSTNDLLSHVQTPPTTIVKQTSTPVPATHTRCLKHSGGTSGGAVAAWNSTLAELGLVLAQRERGEERIQRRMSRGGQEGNTPIRGSSVCSQQQDTSGQWEGREVEGETRQCRAALEALQEREAKLVAEMAELRTELQTASGDGGRGRGGKGGWKMETKTHSPPPEAVVADLQETLRQTEEAVQAVQGERDELREGVSRMQEEMCCLRRSNSLLARSKQQWMEVASQVRVVLEENQSLLSQHKSQQQIISDLRTQHHSRVMFLERELSRAEEEKKAVECQMREGQAYLVRQVSQVVSGAVGGANSPHHSDSLQHIASDLERYHEERRAEAASQQERMECLEKENKSLAVRVADAKAVIWRLEGEMGEVNGVVREGEEAVARLRGQLEEVQEREETSQVQLAHAITQVDKAMAERDAYARIAKRWQSSRGAGDTASSGALEDLRHQLQQQALEHRTQRKRYKSEIHRLRALLASVEESSVGENKRHKLLRKEKHSVAHTQDH